jgi:hypothetical protein
VDPSAELVKSGVLGAIVVVLFGACGYLFKALMKERDKYVQLLSDTLQRDSDHFDTMKEILNFVKDVKKP